jgi:hypothetical protein
VVGVKAEENISVTINVMASRHRMVTLKLTIAVGLIVGIDSSNQDLPFHQPAQMIATSNS